MSKKKTRRESPSGQPLNKKLKQTQTSLKDGAEELRLTEELSQTHLPRRRFDGLNISPFSIKALHSVLKYETMTTVQEATFSSILQGCDVMVKARSGTGKSIAFLLTAIELILEESGASAQNLVYAMIVCPTRQSAQQVAEKAKQLLTFHKNFRAQVVYGCKNFCREQGELSEKPGQILVGTPRGLINHIQNTHNLEGLLRSLKLFVLDEADQMLDMGFGESLDRIRQVLPWRRQNLLFSATIPNEVCDIAKRALRPGYKFIDTVGNDNEDTYAKVKQQYVIASLENQLGVVYSILQQHIEEEPHYKVLIFCTTASVTEFMFRLFGFQGFNCRAIHSRKRQNERNRGLEEFRNSRGGNVLFMSDVSARGVDYPAVTLVIQIGAPMNVEEYIHRLGRTGRPGGGGKGVLVLAPWEDLVFQKLQKKFRISGEPAPVPTLEEETRISIEASKVDLKIRIRAYQSWIGYYHTLKVPPLSRVKVLEYAKEYGSSIGLQELPPLPRETLEKMGLLDIERSHLPPWMRRSKKSGASTTRKLDKREAKAARRRDASKVKATRPDMSKVNAQLRLHMEKLGCEILDTNQGV